MMLAHELWTLHTSPTAKYLPFLLSERQVASLCQLAAFPAPGEFCACSNDVYPADPTPPSLKDSPDRILLGVVGGVLIL